MCPCLHASTAGSARWRHRRVGSENSGCQCLQHGGSCKGSPEFLTLGNTFLSL